MPQPRWSLVHVDDCSPLHLGQTRGGDAALAGAVDGEAGDFLDGAAFEWIDRLERVTFPNGRAGRNRDGSGYAVLHNFIRGGGDGRTNRGTRETRERQEPKRVANSEAEPWMAEPSGSRGSKKDWRS